ncbi:hypothetical protein N9937_00810 [bacterium]|nr:hypothetical protein [bacterium]
MITRYEPSLGTEPYSGRDVAEMEEWNCGEYVEVFELREILKEIANPNLPIKIRDVMLRRIIKELGG